MSREATSGLRATVNFWHEPISSHLTKVVLKIPQALVEPIYHQASLAKQKTIITQGFPKGQTPVAYIEQNYKAELLNSVQEFLLHYCVINSLYTNINQAGIFMAGEPRLTNVYLKPHEDAVFNFELSTWPPIATQPWKIFPFKAPKRKNYKDIDRQVQSFIKEEHSRLKEYEEQSPTIQAGDWIGFEIRLVNDNQEQILPGISENLWVKLGDEEADSSLRNCFMDKHVGDSFYSQDGAFQAYFHQSTDPIYTFHITIIAVIPAYYLCFESFKYQFKLHTKKDLHQKLIEVFSFRNDLSQRRTMAEDAFRLLLHKHPVKIPNHFCLREQQEVLEAVRNNPDYHVYKSQSNFKDYLKTLAEKQVKESLIIDFIAHAENITTNLHDLSAYLNLLKRPRTKEFLYFPLQNGKLQRQEIPIPAALLQRTCRREKTLNHIIYHWTKK